MDSYNVRNSENETLSSFMMASLPLSNETDDTLHRKMTGNVVYILFDISLASLLEQVQMCPVGSRLDWPDPPPIR